MKKLPLLAVFVSMVWSLLPVASAISQTDSLSNSPRLLIRCDDFGMCHTVNMAIKQVIEAKIPISVSLMFVCPWYQEAVEILREHPEVAVGVHLTLNAEWKNYRWGPVLGRSAVPSLVDSDGFFFPSRAKLFDNHPKTSEVEKELRAQIERALQTGLRIDYLDYHMGTAVQTDKLRKIVEKLAKKYQLGIARYFNEAYSSITYNAPIESKTDSLVARMSLLDPERVNLQIVHVGLDSPEMSALIDLNPFGLAKMSKHRQAELQALLSPEFQQALQMNRVKLVTYRDLIEAEGLENMKCPEEFK
ncbi:MAG: ChbG/HpnK family deacetylase [candidate division KSB1 bacterium]|nr:ChbG/HpnK family deacetylase [candidate division KSB1 bacterium]MDZ7304355.1 ChbG/HpnK family deacetylase [candidate division KSB1 bacterium]MDZ7313668.1 ChbG/HpnK family deacetylase [candidate division KSB1 bacterium]